MTKRTIAKTWLVGLLIILAGGVVSGVSTGVWLVNVVTVTGNGSKYMPDNFFWTSMAFVWSGGIIAAGGIIVQLAAWVGAVLNSHHLANKAWFNVLLWVGILGIGTSPLFGLGGLIWWGVTIAYLIGGPDGMVVQKSQTAPTATTLVATS